MARLAMVRPETTSDLKSLRSYCEPHVKIGNKLWRPRITLFLHVWFLNLSNGSSGKKTSVTRFFSFWNAVFLGGRQTLCISTIVSPAAAVAVAAGRVPLLWDDMSSTLFVPWPIMVYETYIKGFSKKNGDEKLDFYSWFFVLIVWDCVVGFCEERWFNCALYL